jgi:hypothetical protein
MNYVGHKIFPTGTLNCLPASSPLTSLITVQPLTKWNCIPSPPTVYRFIYYLDTGYKFPIPPTALTFNGEDRTNYRHENDGIIYVLNKNGSVIRIRFSEYGMSRIAGFIPSSLQPEAQVT